MYTSKRHPVVILTTSSATEQCFHQWVPALLFCGRRGGGGGVLTCQPWQERRRAHKVCKLCRILIISQMFYEEEIGLKTLRQWVKNTEFKEEFAILSLHVYLITIGPNVYLYCHTSKASVIFAWQLDANGYKCSQKWKPKCVELIFPLTTSFSLSDWRTPPPFKLASSPSCCSEEEKKDTT